MLCLVPLPITRSKDENNYKNNNNKISYFEIRKIIQKNCHTIIHSFSKMSETVFF
jgi:hypothetical protein